MMGAIMKMDDLLGLRFWHCDCRGNFGECSQEHGAKACPVSPAPSGTLTWLLIQFAELGASFSKIWIMNLQFFFFFVSSQSKMNWFSRFSLVLPEMDDCCDAVVIRSWIPLERPKVPKISGTLRGETLLRSTAHMSIHDYMGPHMILW